MDSYIIILRFLLVFIASFMFGFERQRAHKPVGFGTFIFVSLGACALAIIALSIGIPGSIALISAVVTGIGFLGAGALIRGADKVFGFTTAAGIWLFAILGLSIGLGYYLIGSVIYFLVWFVIIFDRYFETKGIGSYQRKLNISVDKNTDENEIKECFLTYNIKHKKIGVEFDRKNNRLIFNYIIEGSRDNLNKASSILLNKLWLQSLKIE